MIKSGEYYKALGDTTLNECPDKILSVCCRAPVSNISGSYESGTGNIYDGFACTKCYKHCFLYEHFVLKDIEG